MKGQELITAIEAGLSNKEMKYFIAQSKNITDIEDLADYCGCTVENVYRLQRNSSRKLRKKESIKPAEGK